MCNYFRKKVEEQKLEENQSSDDDAEESPAKGWSG